MYYRTVGASAGAPVVTGSNGGGGARIHGRGFAALTDDGGIGRTFIGRCGVGVANGDGLQGTPVVTGTPGVLVIATASVDLSLSEQLVPIIPEMDSVVVTQVLLSRFARAPDAAVRGGIYAAARAIGVDQSGAAIMPDTTPFVLSAGALSFAPSLSRRSPTALWLRMTVPASAPLLADLEVWGVPRWMALPLEDRLRSTAVTTGNTKSDSLAPTGFVEGFTSAATKLAHDLGSNMIIDPAATVAATLAALAALAAVVVDPTATVAATLAAIAARVPA